jgi:hypothetical protein
VSVVRAGIFPLDEQGQVDSSGYTSALSYQVLWLSRLVPFAEGEQILAAVGQMQIGKRCIWEQTQVHGERLAQLLSKEQAQVSVERTRWQHQKYDPFLTGCVSMEGGRVGILGAGWKAVKVGLGSDLEVDGQAPKPTIRLKARVYRAVIGAVNAFEPLLGALALQPAVASAGRLVGVADGAPWIWRLVAD